MNRYRFPHVQRINDIINGKLDRYIYFVDMICKDKNRNNDIFLDILDRNDNIMDDIEIFFNIINNILYFFDKGCFLVLEDYYDRIRISIKNINKICNNVEYEDNKVEYNIEMFRSVIKEIENIKIELKDLYNRFNSELKRHGINTAKVIKSKEEIMEDLERNIAYNEEKTRIKRENYMKGRIKAKETIRKKKALLEKSMNSNKKDNDDE